MNSELIKAILIGAAYQGATAVCGPLVEHEGKPLPIDPLVQDAGLQAKGVLVYEEAKIQYHALLRAFHDKSGIWPDPKVAAGVNVGVQAGPVGVNVVVDALKKINPNSPIATVGALLGLLTQGVAAPSAPGQELSTEPAGAAK